ncbi:MAG TPA: hypothetical protein VFM79_00380, partial [Pelobium sp.]|nr:hypothetical protein [Pelobium sp.]
MKKIAFLNLLLIVALFSCKKTKVKEDAPVVIPPPVVVVPPPVTAPSLITIGADGKLKYNKYANQGETDSINTIPDFSLAGYKAGGVSLPVAPVKKTLTPIAGDCRALIQAAIDEVGNLPLDANGIRGAVLLKAGKYDVSNSLIISKNGVVLRGEGQGTNGTILKATRTT